MIQIDIDRYIIYLSIKKGREFFDQLSIGFRISGLPPGPEVVESARVTK